MQAQKYLEHLKEILNETVQEDQKTPTKEEVKLIEMKRQPLSLASPSTKIENIKKKNIVSADEKDKNNVTGKKDMKDINSSTNQKEAKKLPAKKLLKNTSSKVNNDDKPKEN
jgi:hypothetical protein